MLQESACKRPTKRPSLAVFSINRQQNLDAYTLESAYFQCHPPFWQRKFGFLFKFPDLYAAMIGDRVAAINHSPKALTVTVTLDQSVPMGK
jgi:hypothetical protein